MNLDELIKDTVYQLERYYFPVYQWTPASISEANLTVNKWISAIDDALPDLDLPNPFELPRILDLGIFQEFWIDNSSCTPREFYEFCIWLKSPESLTDRARVQEEVGIMMRNAASLSTEIAHGRSLEENNKKTRLKYEARIDKLEAQIRKLRLDHEKEIEELRQEHEEEIEELLQEHEDEIQELLQKESVCQEKEEVIDRLDCWN